MPTKNTTPHVARETLPPGAINAKGQQKIVDKITGKTRWIDMKQPRVMSPSGIPVKAEKKG